MVPSRGRQFFKTMTKLKCEMKKCRNVGRAGYLLLDEDGEMIVDVDLPILLCKKHLLAALKELVG